MNNSNATYKADEIHKALDRIKESAIFSKSDIYIFLLDFLVKSFFEKSNVKETLIELVLSEEFDKKQTYEGKVRRYMYNLRKKLEEYYKLEGKNAPFIFEIKKGQYNLTIGDNKEFVAEKKDKTKLNSRMVLGLILLIISIGIVIFFIARKDTNYCWESFFKRKSNTICYVGDHFIVQDMKATPIDAFTFHSGINTPHDLNKAVEESLLDSSRYSIRRFTYNTKMGPICAARLATWFANNNTILDVRMESDFVADNIIDNNIIYIGQLVTLKKLNHLFLGNSKKYAFKESLLYDVKKKSYLNKPVRNNLWYEYVMVTFCPLNDKGNKIMFFAGNHDIGVMATVSNFTDEKWLDKFYKQIPEESSHFNALFLVKGMGRTNIDCELVDVEIVE